VLAKERVKTLDLSASGGLLGDARRQNPSRHLSGHLGDRDYVAGIHGKVPGRGQERRTKSTFEKFPVLRIRNLRVDSTDRMIVARKAGLSTITRRCWQQFLPPDATNEGIVQSIVVRNSTE